MTLLEQLAHHLQRPVNEPVRTRARLHLLDWLEVSFKPWAACRHAHPVIDCALELRPAGGLAAPFHIETYADAISFCEKPNPETEAQAKFSPQHAVAVVDAALDAYYPPANL